MSQIVACPCGSKLRITEKLVGKRIRCPKCGIELEVEFDSPTSKAPAKEVKPIPVQPIQQVPPRPPSPLPSPPQPPAQPNYNPPAPPAYITPPPIAPPPPRRPQPKPGISDKQQGISAAAIAAIGFTIVGLLAVILTAAYFFTRPIPEAASNDNNSVSTESVDASQSDRDRNEESTKANKSKREPLLKAPRSGNSPKGKIRESGSSLSLADLIDLVEPCVVRIDSDTPEGNAIGSGVLVNGDGWIVTNFHVVEGARKLTITNNVGKKTTAVGFYIAEPTKDLAVIKIDKDSFEYSAINLASELPRKGEEVAAFGSPMGFSFSATEGVVSAVRTGSEIRKSLIDLAKVDVYSLLGYSESTNWIQMSAAISGGNSGGPLVDMHGDLVGINTWTTPEAQNLNFASTVDEVRQILEMAKDHKLYEIRYLPKRKLSARMSGGTRRPGQRRPSNGRVEIDINVKTPEEIRAEQAERDAAAARAKRKKQVIENLIPGTEGFVDTGDGLEFDCDGPITAMDISRDRRTLAAVSQKGTLYAFDMDTRKCNYRIETENFLFRDVSVRNKGIFALKPIGNSKPNIMILDSKTGKKVAPKVGATFSNIAKTITVSDDESKLFLNIGTAFGSTVSGILASGEFAKGYSLVDPRIRRKNTNKYSYSTFSTDGNLLIAARMGIIDVFKNDGKESYLQQSSLYTGASRISSFTSSPQHDLVVVGDTAGNLFRVSFSSATKPNSRKLKQVVADEAVDISISVDGRTMVVSRETGQVELRKMTTGGIDKKMNLPSVGNQIALLSDNQSVVVGCTDGKIRILKVK